MSALAPALACAAFWLAIALHSRRRPGEALRLAIALAAGAAAAHLLPALLFRTPAPDPAPGASILFLPLGPLLVCRHALACLALPLALARLGCAAAGCCRGAAGEPIPWLEAAALALLHVGLRRLPTPVRTGAFLLAFGSLRWVEAPWRPGPEGAPLAPEQVALAWALGGAAWILRWVRSRDGAVTNP